MKGYNQKIGKLGEDLAANFLKTHGCKIIDKKFYTPYGEIDLIALFGNEVLFIEVKTRTSNQYGYPETAVDSGKVKRLLKSVSVYRQNHFISFWRLDVISVELNMQTRKAKIHWFKNITTY